jgi:tetratricopeptide (TPR) repeat protein
MTDYTKAIEANPELVLAYINRGCFYDAQGDYDLAIEDFSKAIAVDPRFVAAYNNRAVSYYSKTEYDKAWEDIHKVESLGREVKPDFLEELKKASGREN